MKIVKLVVALTLALLVPVASAADGLVSVKSPYSAKETMNRLEELVKKRGLKVFARIDHAAGAASIGKSLRPTELLIFGNPQGGTPFMECAQSAGIDDGGRAVARHRPAAQGAGLGRCLIPGLALLQRPGFPGQAARCCSLSGR